MNWDKIKYFKKTEWAKDPDAVDPDLIRSVDDLRGLARVPICINVARDYSGHGGNSRHYPPGERADVSETGGNLADAVDLYFKPGLYTPIEQYALIRSFSAFKGVGWYPGWTRPGWHLDLRPSPLYWFRRDGVYKYGLSGLLDELIRGRLCFD